ncbi:MAG: organic hydroperoxide resistance protein [Pauljensenia sp.]
MEALYTAEALSTGAGRNGHVRTSDGTPAGRFDLDLAMPVALGGSGEGVNPELLFAAGYAACYHNALLRVARESGTAVSDTAVRARVGINPKEGGGFTLAVELEVVIPGLDHERAQGLADDAHRVCPYSNATRGNIPVAIIVSDS